MKNEFEVRGDVTAIFIDSPKHGLVETLISTTRLERAKEYPNKWYVIFNPGTKSLYVIGYLIKENGKRRSTRLHRWITVVDDGVVIDHINHDTLDNRDSNLREVTTAENKQNLLGPQSNCKSGIRGVYWFEPARKWKCNIRVNKKHIHLGYFSDIEEAERVVKEARARLMPYSQEALAN